MFIKFFLTKRAINSRIVGVNISKDYDERNPYGGFSEREGRWKPLKFAVSESLLSTVAPERVAVESALRTIEWCFCTIRVVPWINFTPRCVVALYFFVNYFL